MTQHTISAQDHYPRQRIAILDSEMAYIDTAPDAVSNSASGPIVFLHGNPTSSYLWRNIIPHLTDQARCLAPDLIGMGESGKNPAGSYRFMDHYRYLAGWFEAVGIEENVTLVVHDWGSALGFHWAYEQYKAEKPNAVKAIVYMEALVRPVTWDEWPDAATSIFQGMRSPKGEELVLERNFFVERILPSSVLREMDEEAMNVYRQPFLEAGEVRRPTLTWPREIPIGGEPADMVEVIDAYAQWLATSEIPKLFINAEPGIILTGHQRAFCRTWTNQQEVTVNGLHFIQEDSPQEIGEAIADFVSSLRNG